MADWASGCRAENPACEIKDYIVVDVESQACLLELRVLKQG